MHFFVTMPLWLAVILWVIKAIVEKSSQGTVVQRTITAPDGRQTTFVVPANEPASVSIARMYPDSVMQYLQAPVNRTVTIVDPPHSLATRHRLVRDKALLGFLGLIGTAIVCSRLSSNGDNVKVQNPRSSYVVSAQATSSPPQTAIPTITNFHSLSINLEHVRLKTGANIRTSGSKAGAIIRVLGQGTVLAKFGEVNGWTQVGALGADSPEGWIANSTIEPVAP